ncbi:MAG: prepilin peptidase [archaeon]|nr:prepilin peptidase [archaeon]
MAIPDYLISLLRVEGVFSNYNIFLLAVAAFWLIIASIQDFRRREVENWWNFSLIVVVLAFRLFVSVFENNYSYILWGMVGLGFGFILMNLFYYGRMFGGGDAKMLMALGTVIPLSLEWSINLKLALMFILLLLVAGAFYGMIYGIFVTLLNFKKFLFEFKKTYGKYKIISFSILWMGVLGFGILYYLNIVLFAWLVLIYSVCPFLLIWAKAIEISGMAKIVDVKSLTIGDLIIGNVKIGKMRIMPSWDGLSEKELKIIQSKYKKKVTIKYGVPFMPAFLITLLLMIWLML